MASDMMSGDPFYYNFIAVLVFVLIGFVFVYATLIFGRLLRPKKYGRDKMRIYECGEPTIGSPWVRYNIRFYTIALVYLVFDVEVVLLFPAAASMRYFIDAGMGWLALGEIAVFIVILALGLVYAWRYGNLDWVMTSIAAGPQADQAHAPLEWMDAHKAGETARDAQGAPGNG
ncbi:MAG: NADH-quinone oxidoreductase subunit A [bacterium]|nr:NADH-quinone oxidoreductase subunit A [Candidatus Sumerlaeota bacterium]